MTSFSHSCFVYLLGTLPLAHAQHYFGLMIFFLFNMLTCGFWFNIRTLPVVVARVSLLRWGYEAVMINQLSNQYVNQSCSNFTKINLLDSLGFVDASGEVDTVEWCVAVMTYASVGMLFLSFVILILRGRTAGR